MRRQTVIRYAKYALSFLPVIVASNIVLVVYLHSSSFALIGHIALAAILIHLAPSMAKETLVKLSKLSSSGLLCDVPAVVRVFYAQLWDRLGQLPNLMADERDDYRALLFGLVCIEKTSQTLSTPTGIDAALSRVMHELRAAMIKNGHKLE